MWICPECGRGFGKTRQGHFCEPGLSLDEYFATADEREQPIFAVIRDHVESLGDVHIEALAAGIWFKNGPTCIELRPKTKWVAVCFKLPTKLSSDRFKRKVVRAGGSGSKWYHVVNVREAAEVDEQLLDWLTEAYFTADL